MNPATRMAVLKRSRDMMDDLLTEQEKQHYPVLNQLDEIIQNLSHRLKEETTRSATEAGA